MESLTDAKFMTSVEKMRVIKKFEQFLKNGCPQTLFTKALYNHLHLHCGFIAHYNINGFYNTYFNGDFDNLQSFFGYFDRNGWCSDMQDINDIMKLLINKYAPKLSHQANVTTTSREKDVVRDLCAKNGWSFNDVKVSE